MKYALTWTVPPESTAFVGRQLYLMSPSGEQLVADYEAYGGDQAYPPITMMCGPDENAWTEYVPPAPDPDPEQGE